MGKSATRSRAAANGGGDPGRTAAGGVTTSPAEDPLRTPAYVEEHYGIPQSTQAQLRHRGEGPASFRLGGRVRYRDSALLAWLAEEEARAEQRRQDRRGADRATDPSAA